ncbi:STAS domain-containing protein [Ekhidna sp.]|uniref:STAS domain-containing protein n=1 Tax=Ekhidna sp. TaxID=2608089 RepID=UPI003511F589
MKYTQELSNGILKLNFSGDLIGENNGPEVVELANDAIADGITHCLLNISDVRYINSSGIGVLITLLTKFRNKNGELYIINPSEHVNKLLIMTKLQAIFNIAESEEEALQKIK